MIGTATLLPMSIALQGAMADQGLVADAEVDQPPAQQESVEPDPTLPPDDLRGERSFSKNTPSICLMWPPQDGRLDFGDIRLNGPIRAQFFGDWKNMERLLNAELRSGFDKPAPDKVQKPSAAADREASLELRRTTLLHLLAELKQAVLLVRSDWPSNEALADRIWDVVHNMDMHQDDSYRLIYGVHDDPKYQVAAMLEIVSLFEENRGMLLNNIPIKSLRDNLAYLRGVGPAGVPV